MRAEHLPRTTSSLSSQLERWSSKAPGRAPLVAVVEAIAEAGARLSDVVAVSPLDSARPTDGSGSPAPGEAGKNTSGDDQKPLDLYAETLFVDALAGLDVAAVCSEETDAPIVVTAGGRLVVALDPVDGSSNIDVNAPIGTIFAILPAVGESPDETQEGTSAEPDAMDPTAALLRPGRHQLAAGMIVYGPSTVLVLTLGDGTDIYVYDRRSGEFQLARRRIQLPADSREYAINASNARHWGPGIREYVGDLVSGSLGPRERDFNMRWLASLVAETYRILVRGGIFLYPADARPGYQEGRIRLVYEANPIAFLCEQAGGAATDGVTRILDLCPAHLHQRVPFIFGSLTKVERVHRYLLEPQTAHERSPLFAPRGLFRT